MMSLIALFAVCLLAVLTGVAGAFRADPLLDQATSTRADAARRGDATAFMGTGLRTEEFIAQSSSGARALLTTEKGEGRSTDTVLARLRGLLAEEDTSGSWSTMKALSPAKKLGEVTAGILYSGVTPYMVVVGQQPAKDPNTATMIYDFASDTWTAATPRSFVGNHHASEIINNEFYLFGGLTDGFHAVQIGTLVETGGGVDITWRASTDVPIPSGSAATAYINGLVYYCGGIEETNTFTIPNCFTYDPATEQWSAEGDIPDMPEPRNHAATCTDGTSMYIFGGRDGKNVVGPGFADTQIYTPGAGWTTGADIPLARGGMGKAIYWNGECYVFGGEVNDAVAPSTAQGITSTRVVTRVDVYDIATNTWRQAADMPEGMHGIFPVEYEGMVYVAAGGVEAGYSQSTLHFAFQLPPKAEPAPEPVPETGPLPPPVPPATPPPTVPALVPEPDVPTPPETVNPPAPGTATPTPTPTPPDTPAPPTTASGEAGETTTRSVTTLDGAEPSGTPRTTPEPVAGSSDSGSEDSPAAPVVPEASGVPPLRAAGLRGAWLLVVAAVCALSYL